MKAKVKARCQEGWPLPQFQRGRAKEGYLIRDEVNTDNLGRVKRVRLVDDAGQPLLEQIICARETHIDGDEWRIDGFELWQENHPRYMLQMWEVWVTDYALAYVQPAPEWPKHVVLYDFIHQDEDGVLCRTRRPITEEEGAKLFKSRRVDDSRTVVAVERNGDTIVVDAPWMEPEPGV
jgi:hypothetical protein